MSAQIKTKIVSIIRSDFDQTPKYWEGAGWYDNAEEVADDIIALFSSPAPVAVEELVARLGKAYAWARKDGGRPALSLLTEAATALSTLAADKARIEAERDEALREHTDMMWQRRRADERAEAAETALAAREVATDAVT